jgi:hypothetical protein
MKNNIILYGLLAGASFLAYKHFTKKRVNEMEVVDELEIPSSKDRMMKEMLPKQAIKVPVSSQTIRL